MSSKTIRLDKVKVGRNFFADIYLDIDKNSFKILLSSSTFEI